MAELSRGCVLVANPRLPDPNFHRSVVLVLAYGDEGALGVVLDRPGPTDLHGILGGWVALASTPAVVFLGGPVHPDAVICLARLAGAPSHRPSLWPDGKGWSRVVGDLGTLDLDLDPAVVGPRLAEVRMFSGYAGWAPGQLESEIDADAWWVLASEPGDAFATDPARLWTKVLRRQGGGLQLVSSYPEDPSVN